MVKVVDLGEDLPDLFQASTAPYQSRSGNDNDPVAIGDSDDRPNPNISLAFSAALSCYPVISQLARDVDLNTLHELSRTCRQFRANLLQHRNQLIEQTLRCENETPASQQLANRSRASIEPTFGRNGVKVGRISSGKVGACARDLVGKCRRCAKVVCRNCTHKPQGSNIRKGRHRRLCRTCMKCPLPRLTVATTNDEDEVMIGVERTVARSPCTCEEEVWLCQSCGQSVRANDTSYSRGWNWRNRYSACGGLGAGLGEGNEGVECGRDGECLDAKVVEKEVECDSDDMAALEAEMSQADFPGRRWGSTGYMTREVVGVGGRVKKKVKQSQRIGATVKEYEDERMTDKFLVREQEGANRSWCSWCSRVIPGKKDVERSKASTESISSSSSGGSAR